MTRIRDKRGGNKAEAKGRICLGAGCEIEVFGNDKWCTECEQHRATLHSHGTNAHTSAKSSARRTPEEEERLDAEQAILNVKAREAEERETARAMAALGFRAEPGKPLTSPVKIFTQEEIASIENQITPLAEIFSRDFPKTKGDQGGDR